ncbi:ATP-dependent sacrificial sulfur transferase LarE [Clostridium saccharobutylicum]|uniref:TIGR00268 family protein n=1 Tax=Clostridium saccharobutylicum DSM 13864 TaxID=1345695 RepID=U5MPL6_CLOSA|nr:ATP-dependent sacrificial sulfur transferase LarE [Clostridium saccharobutylicum]AGX42754.1 TIGR00268 family protein [Clostridium saccharobutylicum DSM 13864]AQR90051.1 tRNA(Ile)-lysidine synthase [Clostridium saccharobutylicum]AQR99956.1 tRNA(Ile)-lysidine synthase [Clostridium saccharobutylicum]AQS09741.1 tRNA(Ile)-lysidine synthase [Clostridium saccharobutylicum]AQS13940.1 tRNA(Ile)-lysidine synthase [Clostridium saccharobutylicum]
MIKNEKYTELIKYLKGLGKVVLAFSGGVDSTFLLKVGKEALGDNLKAVTIMSPYIPKWEIAEAEELVKELGVEHEIIKAPIIDSIRYNPEDRCYLCKTAVFNMILDLAKKQGYDCVIDGTNFDDISDYRPGLKALKELSVKSPLLECKITKAEIRAFSKELGLNTWDKPPYACLLTRIPYGNELKEEDFVKIENAEKYMMSIGFRAIRVRCHGDLARIEVNRDDRSKLFNEELLDTIAKNIKECGFKYVSLDLQGYRVGSFNETIDIQPGI